MAVRRNRSWALAVLIVVVAVCLVLVSRTPV